MVCFFLSSIVRNGCALNGMREREREREFMEKHDQSRNLYVTHKLIVDCFSHFSKAKRFRMTKKVRRLLSHLVAFSICLIRYIWNFRATSNVCVKSERERRKSAFTQLDCISSDFAHLTHSINWLRFFFIPLSLSSSMNMYFAIALKLFAI